MKRIFILFILVQTLSVKSQTLFTVGKEKVTKQQFLANYNKNYNKTNTDKNSALKENLALLIKYKLKVKAAYDAKLDTLPNQKEELQNFKRQIEEKYMTEDKMMKALVQEAYKRMQLDVRVSHITTLFDKTNGDTVMAYKKALEALKKLNNGVKFEEVATQFSEDPSVVNNKGDLNFVNVFSLPYDMETAVYNTPINNYSGIVKSKIGYHIFKRTAERPAIGKMQAAQILIQNIAGGNAVANEAKVKMVYEKHLAGENFENLARTYSNDVYSASNGGQLQPFTVGQYDPIFEQEFNKLKDGEVSKPFFTQFGWHILKRIKNVPPSKTLDAEIEQEILARINSDSRKQKAEDIFVAGIMKQINYKPAIFNMQQLVTDAKNKIADQNAATKISATTILHTFNTVYNVTAADYFNFVRDAQSVSKYKSINIDKLYNEYVKITASDYYRNNLELYNAEYKAQLQEFKDGNLLFEVMERNVWNKSANDEAGLKAYYDKNNKNYKWTASADGIIFNSNNLSELNALSDKLNTKTSNWQEVLKAHEDYVRADSGRFELSYIPVLERTAFSEGLKTLPFSPNNDGNYVFTYIIKLYPEGQQKTYEEAKGLAMNDYQTVLETKWLDDLRKKNPVKVNEAVWKTILNAK